MKDAADAKDGDLVVGTEYYAVMAFDSDIYTGNVASDPVAFTCQTAGTGSQGSNGGMMGGGGGNYEIKPTDTTFDEGAETFALNIGEHDLLHTTANLLDAEEGDTYTYKLEKGDPNAPFDVGMMLHLKEDGTVLLNVEAGGPISAAKKTGTWTVEDGVITLGW